MRRSLRFLAVIILLLATVTNDNSCSYHSFTQQFVVYFFLCHVDKLDDWQMNSADRQAIEPPTFDLFQRFVSHVRGAEIKWNKTISSETNLKQNRFISVLFQFYFSTSIVHVKQNVETNQK